jgi:cyclophilin family peptidyl-prolyl cis-trans isomerase
VVFGRITENYDLVKKIESYGSSSGKPSRKVKIASCSVVDTTATDL